MNFLLHLGGTVSNEVPPEGGEKSTLKRCISMRSDYTVWKNTGSGMSSQFLQVRSNMLLLTLCSSSILVYSKYAYCLSTQLT